MSGVSSVTNAMSILESRLEIPPNPTSVFEFVSSVQSLKHSQNVLLRYLQSIPLSAYEQLFIQAESDCDPYEVIIDCFHMILLYVIFER